jgi:4-hydroxyphenylpyruvate dioxygenase
MTKGKNNGHDQAQGFPKLKALDYIEFYVGNAYQSAHFYRSALGLKPIAFAGLETGLRDRASVVVAQGDIRLVLTAAQGPEHPIAEHVRVHGDGVRDIAFLVDDVEQAFGDALARGAKSICEPQTLSDEHGSVTKATIAAYGDTVHSFVQRNGYEGSFLPGFRALRDGGSVEPTGLTGVDHIAVSAEAGQLDDLVNFYSDVFGFHQSHQEDVATEYSAMNSKVVQSNGGHIKFPIVEPASGKGKSQIDEYLSYYGGAGVQHIAFLSEDIVGSVRALRENYIEFMRTPDTYYECLQDRVGQVEVDMGDLRELSILVDRDEWGYLMQTFTRPLHSRPTVFFEIIQRKNARGFGAGNIKALFEALEREQLQRGNL